MQATPSGRGDPLLPQHSSLIWYSTSSRAAALPHGRTTRQLADGCCFHITLRYNSRAFLIGRGVLCDLLANHLPLLLPHLRPILRALRGQPRRRDELPASGSVITMALTGGEKGVRNSSLSMNCGRQMGPGWAGC